MNNEKDKIDNFLKEAHDEIEPRDSWQALRKRIDEKIESNQKDTGDIRMLHSNIAFWRRIALAAAACLVITSGLLIYVAFSNHNHLNPNLLAQEQLQQLSEAFSQVQEVFNQNCPWMVINSTGKGDIGIENQDAVFTDSKKLIVLRLALNLQDNNTEPEYFDIVTYDNQLVSFDTSISNGSNMNIAIRPVITEDNRIKVEIDTQINSGSKTSNTVTIASDSFKSLVQVKNNGNMININATGHSLSNI